MMKVVGCSVLYVFLFAAQHICDISAKKLHEANEENCEVCVKFLSKFIEKLDSDSDIDRGNQKVVEAEFKKFCKGAKKDDNRFCYYIGGTDDSATSTLNVMSKPVSWGVPADKVCMKLYRN